ncbi:hypothetical protein ACTID9_17710 [Brevibacillus fluminis]|uniref:hypothetical protein n=1 Tax=Brevibacillus fluminis TaxID=511487 RepID=UPI003F8B73C7
MSLKVHDQTPISQIREEQTIDDKAKIARLETELAAAKEENLMIMEATAQIYEVNLALKEESLNTMEALAQVYEELLALKGGSTGG